MDDTSSLKVVKRGTREIVITRDFDAARGRVFDAWTKPDVLRRWFGPKGWSLAICEVDLKVGGAWRLGRASRTSPGEMLVTTALVEDGGRKSYAKLDDYFACTPTK